MTLVMEAVSKLALIALHWCRDWAESEPGLMSCHQRSAHQQMAVTGSRQVTLLGLSSSSGQHQSTQQVYLFCLSIFSDTRQCASNKTIKVPSYNDPEAGFERLHDKCQDVRRVMVIPRKLFRDQKNPDQWKLDIPGQPHSKDIEDFPQRLHSSTVPFCAVKIKTSPATRSR